MIEMYRNLFLGIMWCTKTHQNRKAIQVVFSVHQGYMLIIDRTEFREYIIWSFASFKVGFIVGLRTNCVNFLPFRQAIFGHRTLVVYILQDW